MYFFLYGILFLKQNKIYQHKSSSLIKASYLVNIQEAFMRKLAFFLSFLLFSSQISASEMVFGFKNPAFSGEGYSTHMLTIEQEEFSRKQARESATRARQEAAATAAANTNLHKFLNNLESRIYAQLSLQLSNAIFADGSTTGTLNFEGSVISWVKDTVNQTINLTVIDANNNRTEITVPIGSFKF